MNMMIQDGARVKHKDGTVNDGLPMLITEVDYVNQEAVCSMSDMMEQRFSLDSLIVVEEAEPPFKNPGE